MKKFPVVAPIPPPHAGEKSFHLLTDEGVGSRISTETGKSFRSQICISEARDPLMSNRADVPALPSKVSVAISINGNLREFGIFFHGQLLSTSFARNFSSPARRRGAIMGSVVPALCSSMACASIRALLLRS